MAKVKYRIREFKPTQNQTGQETADPEPETPSGGGGNNGGNPPSGELEG